MQVLGVQTGAWKDKARNWATWQEKLKEIYANLAMVHKNAWPSTFEVSVLFRYLQEKGERCFF